MEVTYRKEKKYIITIDEYLRIRPWIEGLMNLDQNAVEGKYCIRTLYFDSIHDRDLADNIDGVYAKRKIRLRSYFPNLYKGKLECKAKEGSDGYKIDVWVDRKDIEEILDGDYSCLVRKNSKDSLTLYHRMMSGHYRPKTIVQYNRVAYTHDISRTRVTFDTNVKGTGTGLGFFNDYPGFIPLIPTSHGVLEIKYNDFPPYPIAELMKHLDMIPQANSKYTQARNLL